LKEYFGFYPNKGPGSSPNIFDYESLEEFNPEKLFWLTPGYSDFVYLSSTSDVNKLRYGDTDSCLSRTSSSLGWFNLLPIHTHLFLKMVETFQKKFESNGKTALRNLESILHMKLSDLECVPNGQEKERSEVFGEFFSATLKRYGHGITLEEIPGGATDEKIVIFLNVLHFFLHIIG
jgi:hypothetical protein